MRVLVVYRPFVFVCERARDITGARSIKGGNYRSFCFSCMNTKKKEGKKCRMRKIKTKTTIDIIKNDLVSFIFIVITVEPTIYCIPIVFDFTKKKEKKKKYFGR